MVDEIPKDVMDAMYPVFEDESSQHNAQTGSSTSSGKGIACIGTSTRLVDVQHRLCEQSGMGIVSAPALVGSFVANLSSLCTWCKQSTPQVILFDNIALAAGLAQQLNLPVLRAKEVEYDSELQRLRVRAPLYGGLISEEAVAKNVPQIVLIL